MGHSAFCPGLLDYNLLVRMTLYCASSLKNETSSEYILSHS
jgi:hypothetical protein